MQEFLLACRKILLLFGEIRLGKKPAYYMVLPHLPISFRSARARADLSADMTSQPSTQMKFNISKQSPDNYIYSLFQLQYHFHISKLKVHMHNKVMHQSGCNSA